MAQVSLILGSHCHIPEYPEESRFEAAYEERLKPFLTALYRFPEIPAVLHYSGPALYWIERRRPEFFDLIREMLKRKQVELLSGGFYEPAMPLISSRDMIGQIEMLTTYLRRHFGKRPLGAYIPAAVWCEAMPSVLNDCSIAHVFLPESLFLEAGVPHNELGRMALVERQGSLLVGTPIMPFDVEPAEFIKPTEWGENAFERLKALVKKRGGRGIFSIFPEWRLGCGEDVYKTALTFLEQCAKNLPQDWIWAVPSRLREDNRFQNHRRSIRRVYFHYGREKNYLCENPDANLVYARMLMTHGIIQRIKGDRERKKAALHELYKAQCYSIYTGGISASADKTLRRSAFSALIAAEKILREVKRPPNAALSFDYDFDGNEENFLSDNKLCCFIHKKGGRLLEIDYFPAAWNYIDICSGESFAQTLYAVTSNSGNPTGALSVLDAPGENTGQVRRLAEEWWEETNIDRAKLKFTLSCDNLTTGRVAETAGALSEIALEKTYQLKRGGLSVQLDLCNKGSADCAFVLGTELHLAFPDGAEGLRVFALKGEERAAIDHPADIDGVLFQDLPSETAITLSADKTFHARLVQSAKVSDASPIDAHVRSLFVYVPFHLKAGAKSSMHFRLIFTH